MPIRDCPFTKLNNTIARPILLLEIINPHTNLRVRTYGIIDTGADDCAVPAFYADLLGHNLEAGIQKKIHTGNGVTVAFSHTTRFKIYHPSTRELLYTIDDTPIDFLPNLHMILLGVNNFLSNFILHINYPAQTFSIRYP